MNKKLTESEAQSIISRVEAGESQKKLAAEYGLSQAAVSKLVRGKTWPHLLRAGALTPQRGTKLLAADIPAIRSRLSTREPAALIAKDYGVTRQTISDIHKGKTWSHIPKETAPTRRCRVWEQEH